MSDYADNLRRSMINKTRRFMRMVQEMQEKDDAALREQVIRMAREAGWDNYDSQDERLERFFLLAAAAGAEAEREACAKVCEDEAEKWEGDDGPISTEARLCAINIRARGEKTRAP